MQAILMSTQPFNPLPHFCIIKTHFNTLKVVLICRTCPRALAPSGPILFEVKLHVWHKSSTQSPTMHKPYIYCHTHLSSVKVRLVCRACPSTSAPLLPMLIRFKLCVAVVLCSSLFQYLRQTNFADTHFSEFSVPTASRACPTSSSLHSLFKPKQYNAMDQLESMRIRLLLT